MTGQQNKVKFGLKNVHYAVVLEETAESITYDTPKRLPGAVEISISANGEIVEKFADDITYWSAEINNGYDGELTIADIPDDFLTEVLGLELKDGVIYESADSKGKKFALLFEINGDVKARRSALYYCTATRPTVASKTKEGATVEPQDSQLSFQARPRPTDGMIKAQTTVSVNEVVYNNWYNEVHEKTSGV